MKKAIVCFILIVGFLVIGNANAALINRGGGLIYDSSNNITWLMDANYAKTTGSQDNGKMNYGEASSWIAELEYYDTVRDITWDDWRLPETPGTTVSDGGIFTTEGELGYLYSEGIRVGSSSPFINLANSYYWTGTDGSNNPIPNGKFAYDFGQGLQRVYHMTNDIFVWAVRDGDVSSVPIPSAVWLLGSGLIGLVGFRRKIRKT